MQQWEYKILYRKRNLGLGIGTISTTQWDVDIEQLLPSIGAGGWELVAVCSRSSIAGQVSSGTTTEEEWIFKRPKA